MLLRRAVVGRLHEGTGVERQTNWKGRFGFAVSDRLAAASDPLVFKNSETATSDCGVG